MKEAKTQLTPEAQEVRRKYFREYRRKHPDKMREYERRRWEKKAAEQKAAEQAEKAENELDDE